MASQPSQSQNTVRMCMPLLKFSHATVSESNSGPIPWVHIPTRDDLFAIIDSVDVQNVAGAVEKRPRFKVLRDPEVEEDIDLSVLAVEAHNAASRVQGTDGRSKSPAITVISKLPCIAMRYPMSSGRVRRFQIRFQHDEHFHQTIERFTQVGVPILEAGDGPYTSRRPFPFNAVTDSRIGAVPEVQRPSTANASMHFRGSSNVVRPATTLWQPLSQPCMSGVENNYATTAPGTNDAHFGRALQASKGLQTAQSLPPREEIDLYVPRSSTAPASRSHNSIDDMPPKRTLPFTTRSRASGTEPGHCHNESATQPELNKSIGTASTKSVLPKNNFVSTGTITPTKKRASPKAKKPPQAKRQRVTTSRKKPVSRKSVLNKLPLIPEEEVVSEDEPADALTKPAASSTIDTQALIQHAEERLRASNHKSMHTLNHGLNNSQSQQLTRSQSSQIQDTKRSQYDKAQQQAQASFKSSTKQPITNTLASNTETRRLTRSMRQQSNNAPDHLISTAPAPDPTSEVASEAAGDANANLETLKSHALRRLMTDPTFAPAFASTSMSSSSSSSSPPPSRFTAAATATGPTEPTENSQPNLPTTFNDLPDSIKHEILETWMCKNFDDEDFVNLCKTLDQIWSRSLVKY